MLPLTDSCRCCHRTFEVIVLPCILWGCVLLYYLSRVATVGHTEAAATAWNDAFFVLFLAYPVICNKLFKMLECRQLGPDQNVRGKSLLWLTIFKQICNQFATS